MVPPGGPAGVEPLAGGISRTELMRAVVQDAYGSADVLQIAQTGRPDGRCG